MILKESESIFFEGSSVKRQKLEKLVLNSYEDPQVRCQWKSKG